MPTPKIAKDSAQLPTQNSESIQMVFDLTSRTDERVKMIIEHQKEIEEQIEKLIIRTDSISHRLSIIDANDFASIKNNLHSLREKVAVITNDNSYKELIELRAKIQSIELKAENIQIRLGFHDHRWSQIFDLIWKMALMCIAGYILYKLGLQPPP